jgi:sulfofructosephosphate aldolase
VPFHGKESDERIQEHCRQITAILPCPWVVLSQGVDPARFAVAVRSACLGGASGFLAGRAIWSDAIGPGDCRARLRDIALPRLQQLVQIVDSSARPWNSAAPLE